MAKKLEEMTVRFGSNGGHTVRHEFAREAVKRGGAMNSGIYSDRPPSEEHHFGPDDGAKLMDHISEHLGVKTETED